MDGLKKARSHGLSWFEVERSASIACSNLKVAYLMAGNEDRIPQNRKCAESY